jgi:hypothetical protein
MSADNRIPDVLLERYRLNELPMDEADRMAARLGQDARLRDRLAALEASDEELRGGTLPDRLEEGMRRTLAERGAGPRRSSAYWAVSAVAAAAIVVIAVVARTATPPAARSAAAQPPPGVAEDRVKGLRPALALYRRTAEGSETLADGAVGRKGDLIRVGYRAAGRSFGAIVSIDGGGSVTLHLPPAGDRAAALKREATVLLDQAYELDNAPLWERFYFIAGDAPFEVAPVMQAARDAATKHAGSPPAGLALPRGLEQSSFTLQKEGRP